MLTDKHLDRYAAVLIWGLKKARLKKYRNADIITIRFDLAALKLAEILQAKLLHMGMNPMVRFNGTPTMDLNFFGIADPKQLIFQPPGSLELCKKLNGSIFLNAPESLTHLRTIDPRKIGRTMVARKPLSAGSPEWAENGVFTWAVRRTSDTKSL